MAFGELVKSLVVRFTTENFERTRLEIDSIGERARDVANKDYKIKFDADTNALSRKLEQLLTSGPLSSLSPLLNNLSTALSPAGGIALVGVVGAILAYVGSIASALGAAAFGVAAFGALAYPTFTKIFDAVTGVAGAMKGLDPAERQIVKGIQGLETEFGKLALKMEPVVTKILGTGLQIAQKLLPFLLPFAETAGNAILKLAEGVSKFASSKGFSQFMDTMLKLSGPAIMAIGEGIGHVAVAIGKLLEKLANPQSITMIKDTFKVIAVLIDWLGRWITNVEQVGHDVGNWAKDVMQWYDRINNRINQNLNQIIHDMRNWGADVGRWFTVDIPHWIGNAIKWFESLPGKVMNALSKLPKMLFGAGAQAMSGLISGFASMVGRLLGDLANWGHDAANFLVNPFGIHLSEPSEAAIMIRAGQRISEGLAMGITSRSSLVNAALRGIGFGSGSLNLAGARPMVLQIEWVNGGSADQEFITWLKRHIRIRGGDPNILGR